MLSSTSKPWGGASAAQLPPPQSRPARIRLWVSIFIPVSPALRCDGGDCRTLRGQIHDNHWRRPMQFSMYQATAPGFINILTQLKLVLKKGEDYAAARKIDPLVLTGGRLFPDMFPL
ncbi:MAG TPA: DUF1993 family protein, partial [Gammaproteobacteria bacterium]